MPVINLIQEQRQALHKSEQRARIGLMTLTLTGLAGALGYGILYFQKEALTSEISRLNLDLQKTAPVVAQIEANEKQEDLLTPELTTLTDAQKRSDCWVHILQHLATQTPKDAWLTAMQSNALEGDKPITVVLQGTAKSQQPIGEFILRVENEPDLENVALHFTQEKRSFKGKAIDFEIGADIAGSEDQKKTAKEDDKS
jgi:Tfp pilus assembly protein PilN